MIRDKVAVFLERGTRDLALCGEGENVTITQLDIEMQIRCEESGEESGAVALLRGNFRLCFLIFFRILFT